jgi:hypothetical protein
MALNASGVIHLFARRNMSSIEESTHAWVDSLQGQVRYRTSERSSGVFRYWPISAIGKFLIGLRSPNAAGKCNALIYISKSTYCLFVRCSWIYVFAFLSFSVSFDVQNAASRHAFKIDAIELYKWVQDQIWRKAERLCPPLPRLCRVSSRKHALMIGLRPL